MSLAPFVRDGGGNLARHSANHARLRAFLLDGEDGRQHLICANDAEGMALVRLMTRRGTSVILNWGEDTGQWECSWIFRGERYTGVRADPFMAVWEAVALAMEAAEKEEGQDGER